MTPTRDALEAALARAPDDLTLHMAYADCLIEEGDPRGEYVRLCLAAEDAAAGKKERKARREAAAAVLRRHEADWLGPLGEFLIAPDESRRRFGSRPRLLPEWHRGWVVGLTCYGLSGDLVATLRSVPPLPFLESLAVDANSYRRPQPAGEFELVLPTLYDFLNDWSAPRLRRLWVQDTEFGDDGVAVLLRSPAFPRLTALSLTNCHITDDGALLLAAHPHTPKLESLRLENNLLSPIGIEALAEVGVRVSELQRFGRLEDV